MGRNLSPVLGRELANLDKDADSRKSTMKALKSYVKDLDSKAIPLFLAQVSETKETGSLSGEYTISLYEVLAQVHGVNIVPQFDSIMAIVIKSVFEDRDVYAGLCICFSTGTQKKASLRIEICMQDIKLDGIETTHFVLVHGGGFGAWCWYKTIALLEESGYRVSAVDLTGSGIHSFDTNGIVNVSQYVKPLTNFLENLADEEKDVALASVSMRPIPFAPVLEKLCLFDMKYGTVRRFYVGTLEDNAIPLTLQESMINAR